MATSFSGKSIRDKEPVMNKHIDFLMGKIREFGRAEEGMDMGKVRNPIPIHQREALAMSRRSRFLLLIQNAKWIEWLGMDLSVDLVFGWELNLLRESKYFPSLSSGASSSFSQVDRWLTLGNSENQPIPAQFPRCR